MGSNAQRKATSSGRACDAGSMKRQKTWDDATGEQQHASKKRFVGVRQRPSGRWVAEIKDTTQKIRLWLGTFDSAEEGAKAYDSAARALRGANTRTNFVTALSCEAPAASSKAARLIRLRQIAAANAKLEAEKLDRAGAVSSSSDPLLRHDVNPQSTCSDSDRRVEDDRHSQVTTPPFLISSSPPKPPHKNSCRDNASPDSGPPPASADSDNGPSFEPITSSLKLEPQITAENLSNAANLMAAASPQLLPDSPLSRLPSKNCCNSPEALQPNLGATPNEKRDPPPPETSAVSAFSCATSESSCASSGSSSDQLQHDAIPWSDYVLADALDLPSCETNCGFAVYASAFDFWAEAMDRDSCASSHVLLEDHSDVDSTEFLLTATIPHDHQSASGSSDMDRVGGDAGEICSSHDGDDQLEPGGPLWITQCAYKGPCSHAR